MPQLKHLVIDDFLPPEVHAGWLQFAIANQTGFAASEVRRAAQGQYDPAVRRSQIYQSDLGELEAAFVATILNRQSELLAGTGTPPFAISKCEVELAVHRDGCFFAAHQDTLTREDRIGLSSDRIVSVVYYFHAQPQGFSGGALVIHPFGESEASVIEPRDNRLVVFPAFALHEVRPVLCPGDAFASARFSINCWLRRAAA
jgi:SM-20-related protein